MHATSKANQIKAWTVRVANTEAAATKGLSAGTAADHPSAAGRIRTAATIRQTPRTSHRMRRRSLPGVAPYRSLDSAELLNRGRPPAA